MFRENGTDCDSCSNHYTIIKHTEPPCVTDGVCKFGKPELWLSNRFAWELFQKCANQVIVAGMGDVLGIKFEAIEFLLNLYGVEDLESRRELFEKIQIIDTIRSRYSKKSSGTIGNNKPRTSKK